LGDIATKESPAGWPSPFGLSPVFSCFTAPGHGIGQCHYTTPFGLRISDRDAGEANACMNSF
jgi:hypothetical protein